MRSDVSFTLTYLDLFGVSRNFEDCLAYYGEKMLVELLFVTILDFLGLWDPWVVFTTVVYVCIHYYDIVSGSIIIDYKVLDCQLY